MTHGEERARARKARLRSPAGLPLQVETTPPGGVCARASAPRPRSPKHKFTLTRIGTLTPRPARTHTHIPTHSLTQSHAHPFPGVDGPVLLPLPGARVAARGTGGPGVPGGRGSPALPGGPATVASPGDCHSCRPHSNPGRWGPLRPPCPGGKLRPGEVRGRAGRGDFQPQRCNCSAASCLLY